MGSADPVRISCNDSVKEAFSSHIAGLKARAIGIRDSVVYGLMELPSAGTIAPVRLLEENREAMEA